MVISFILYIKITLFPKQEQSEREAPEAFKLVSLAMKKNNLYALPRHMICMQADANKNGKIG